MSGKKNGAQNRAKSRADKRSVICAEMGRSASVADIGSVIKAKMAEKGLEETK
jgi:hypothetical protein